MPKEDNLPKKYILDCKRCSFKYLSNGLRSDLSQFREISACCGKRKYRCPQCSNIITLTKVNKK